MVLAFGLAACDADPMGPEREATSATSASSASAAASDYADDAPTFDAVLNDVSLRHPGFKGLVGSEDGTRTLVLAEGPAALAQSGLIPELARVLRRDVSRLVLTSLPDQAAANRPDFHELYAVKTALRRFLVEGDLVNWLDIDDETGLVTVGTASDAAAAQVRDGMTPEELALVDFIRTEPFVPAVAEIGTISLGMPSVLSSVNRSLRNDAFRPLTAGAETKFHNPRLNRGTACTQGPAVLYGGNLYGFLSNAHCTLDRTRTDNTEFFQPVRFSDLIGVERDEPSYRSGWFIIDGYYSDAAFVRTEDGIELQGRMTSADNCSLSTSDCVENGIINDVVGTSSYLPKNVRVFKTGRSTGSTAGRITGTCVDLVSADDGFKNLCQSVVSYDSNIASPYIIVQPGDSGSAVLTNGGTPGSNSGTVAGILWGSQNEQTFAFSPWENIWQEERAGTDYGLPIQIVTASQGAVSNQPGSGGGGTSEPVECTPEMIVC